MGPMMKLFVEVVSQIFEIPTPIFELGSLQIPEGFADLRPFFSKKIYFGLDMRQGVGVNITGCVEHLPFKNESVGTLLSVATLEHVENPIKAFDEFYRVVSKKGGMVVLTSVFNFPIHAYPNDFWRFTPECFNLLLEQFNPRIICALGPSLLPKWIMGIGFKSIDVKSQMKKDLIENKTKLLHQTYLRKIPKVESLKKNMLKKIVQFPIFSNRSIFFLKDLEIELTSTMYYNHAKCFTIQSKI